MRNLLFYKKRAKTINEQVNVNKADLEKKTIQHKMFLIEKPLLIKQQNEFIQELINDYYKQVFKMKSWLKLMKLLELIKMFKTFKDVIIH